MKKPGTLDGSLLGARALPPGYKQLFSALNRYPFGYKMLR